MENKQDITTYTTDVAGMGKNAWNIIEKFLPSSKFEELKSKFNQDSKLRVSVSFFKGDIFDFRYE